MSKHSFFYRWLVGGLGLLVATWLIDGLRYDGNAVGFVLLALIFGLVNALLKPLLTLLTCPLVLLTLGLFMLILNGLLLQLTGSLGRTIGIPYFVDSFWSAFWGGIIVSLVAFLATLFFGDERPEEI